MLEPFALMTCARTKKTSVSPDTRRQRPKGERARERPAFRKSNSQSGVQCRANAKRPTVACRYVTRRGENAIGDTRREILRGARESRHDGACERRRDARTNENIARRVSEGRTTCLPMRACNDLCTLMCVCVCVCVEGGDGDGARRRFSTGRIAKWQPAGLLYVQEIYRPWPFRARAKGRPRSLWQQTGGSQHLPFYFPGCKPSAPRRLSLSLRQVILLHRPAAAAASSAANPPRRRTFPFFSLCSLSSVFPRPSVSLPPRASSPRPLFRFSNVVASRRRAR